MKPDIERAMDAERKTQQYADAVAWLIRIEEAEKELKDLKKTARQTLETRAGQLASMDRITAKLEGMMR